MTGAAAGPGVLTAGIGSWQMTPGERAAYEGVLSFTRPRLAVEVGSAAGGSVARTAAWAGHVHSFDLRWPSAPAMGNVTFHVGDSHQVLAPWLAKAERDGLTVDFAHVDGDHTPAGAARDITDLLGSRAFDGVMLVHDAANPDVRRGLDLARLEDFPDVAYADCDFVPGRATMRPGCPESGEIWGGFALVVVDRARRFRPHGDWVSGGIRQDRYYPVTDMLLRAFAGLAA